MASRVPGLLFATAVLVLAGCANVRPMTNAGAQWPFYNGGLAGDRYSGLRQIDAANAAALQVVCQRTLEKATPFETGPVVAGGRLFLTTADATFAVDPGNCAVIWRAVNSKLEDDVVSVNRGVAFMQGRLFRGTTDGSVLAIDAASGANLWSVKVFDPRKGERFTMAPIAWRGKVFIGDAVSDNGIRGQVIALDARTGRLIWRTSTIDGSSWPRGAVTGGGGVWSSFALDERSGELLVSVSNPAPDFVPAARPGSNLYTNSVLALDAGSGSVRWFYQVTRRDEHDWDLGAAPMLFTLSGRNLVAAGSKDGFLSVIDRHSHALIYRTQLTTVTNAEVPLGTTYLHVCPGWTGGVEWNGPALDRLNRQIVVGAVDWCGRYFQTPGRLRGAGGFLGGGYAPDPVSSSSGWIDAVDARTGRMRWRYHARAPVVGGLTPTAGDVTFAGDTAGDFFVFDSASGKRLFERKMPGAVAGGVVTYSDSGRQYVAVATGPTLRTTFSSDGDATLVILAPPSP